MAVRPEAEVDEVEWRSLPKQGRIALRIRTGDGMKTREVADAGEQRLPHEPLVCGRVVGRHAALVTEKALDSRPIDCRRRQGLVAGAGGVATRQCDAKCAIGCLGGAGRPVSVADR